MSSIQDYKNAWTNYRERITAAVEKRDRELARLEKYEGKRAEEEREAARVKFNQAVEVARNEARGRFGRVLEDMRDKADAIGEVMQAPTQEQVSILQMLSLRSSITQSEAESAARALAGNDDCLTTLQQLCATRGGVIVHEIAKNKSKRAQAFDALGAFRDAAGACLQWSGGSRSELMTERAAQYMQHVPESERVSLGAAIAADVDAQNMSQRDFTRVVVGNAASVEATSLID